MHDHLHPDERALQLALTRARPAAEASCPDLVSLASFVDGSAGSDQEAIEAHLAACAACRRAVLHARDALTENAQTSTVPADVVDAARRLVALPEVGANNRSRSSRSSAVWPTVLRWGLAAAASFAICALGHRIGSDLVRARDVSHSNDLYSLGVLTSFSPSAYDDAISVTVFPSTTTEEVSP